MGIGVLEFWDLTPAETYAAIEGAIKREELRQRKDLALAWRIAAFTRAKKLPPLKKVLNTAPAKPLRGAERDRRRREFAEMTTNLDLSKLPGGHDAISSR